MKVVVTCLAPLSHGSFGDEAGNAMPIRRMALVSLPGAPRVPCVSGNALRGALRRIVMRDLFARCELSRETVPSPAWDRLYAALANGGHLEGSEERVSPDSIRELRAALPPLSVFGAALYSYLLPGHMSVGILWPRCKETLEAGLVADAGKGGGGMLAEDLVEEVSHCRHVDREQQSPELSGVTPMPTTVEVLSTGTVLESEITFAAHASDRERGAIMHGLSLMRALGGKAAGGFGRVSIDCGEALEPSDLTSYQDWLGSKLAKGALMDLVAQLGPRKAKKGK